LRRIIKGLVYHQQDINIVILKGMGMIITNAN